LNVLVIEDHATDRKLLTVVLNMDGHVVHEKPSAEGAIEKILEVHPDVVLIDLRLPGVDGLTLIRQLKGNEETRHVPVVVVTAYPEAYPRDELLAAGCAAYIVKPIDTRELSRRLAELVEARQAG
jgi:CheY-like chemotaxis protein